MMRIFLFKAQSIRKGISPCKIWKYLRYPCEIVQGVYLPPQAIYKHFQSQKPFPQLRNDSLPI